MGEYFKATRPDGTDFYSGTVRYAVGESVPVLTGPAKCCSAGVYHASDAASETLIGCEWPCRLFKVEGEPVAQRGHKFGFRTLRVLEEIPAHLALGPNGKEVVEFLALIPGVIAGISSATYNAARSAGRNTAYYAASNAACNAARDAASYVAYNAACNAARNAAYSAAGDVASYAAGDAAGDAAAALVAKDLIATEWFDTLQASWRALASA